VYGSGNLYLNIFERRKQQMGLFLFATGCTLIDLVRNTAISSALRTYAAEEINKKEDCKNNHI
jgi:hypothetical protein